MRSTAGTFLRTHQLWTPDDRWEDGWVDNKGRFRVYRPDYPRAYAQGMALRYHVVWWLAPGEPHPVGTVLHHVNHDKTDDRLENLALLVHGEHSRLHKLQLHEFVCENCGDHFVLTGDRVATRRAEGKTPRFCSQACYQISRRKGWKR